MPREELEAASRELREAAEVATDELTDRVSEQADRVQDLAERDRDPDHGTLARVERKLGTLRDDAGEEVAERVDAALERIRAFRSTVDGV